MRNKMRIVVWIVMLIGGGISSIIIDIHFFRSLFFSYIFHIITFLPGILLLFFVLMVSRNTGRLLASLGREGNIPRMETNRLVTSHIYGCMRHPMHFGLLFFPLSFALLLGSPFFIFVLSPLEMVFMVIMIKLIEEKELIKKFGEDYIQYMKRVPMFSLKISCLKLLFKPYSERFFDC